MSKLSSDSLNKIHKAMKEGTADPAKDLPCASFYAVDKNGDELVSVATGQMGSETSEPINEDTVFWIASCTKIACSMAAMQLVEQGKLRLDDSELIDELLPEIKNLPILKEVNKETGELVLVPRKNRITLRHLLTHTAGFGYHFSDDELTKWRELFHMDVFNGVIGDMIQPLKFEPGTDFLYGISLDWAGTCIERATGLTLEQYCQQNIFQPLDLTDITFIPDEKLQKKLVKMNKRTKEGDLKEMPHPMAKSLSNKIDDLYYSAGAGLFSSPKTYCRVLTTLLNDGYDPKTGNRILSKDSVEEMFTNQIPQMPYFGKKGLLRSEPDYTNGSQELLAQGPEVKQGWGISMMLNTTKQFHTGRGMNSGNWGGIANLAWWCDRAKGVAGFFAAQILPYGDQSFFPVLDTVETEVYKGLGKFD